MRLSAYKKAIDEAKALPTDIPELSSYFQYSYNPQEHAILFILDIARQDNKSLFHGEFIELYSHAKEV